MTSKADKVVLARNYDKNKKKLSRTISKVINSLSSLNINEKTEQLQILQRQLNALDKHLDKRDEFEVTSGKKASKPHPKKLKKKKNEKADCKDDGGQQIGSFRLLPLGIGIDIKNQVKSKIISSNLNDAVARRNKSTQKELIPKSNTKKKSSKVKCSELVNEYLAFDLDVNVENQKKSKKERKKLKTLKEISNKMEKSFPDKQKSMNSIQREVKSDKSKVVKKKSMKAQPPQGPTFSNLVCSSEQYYFLTAGEGCKDTKSSKVATKKVKKIKEQSKCSEPEGHTFSNFVSFSEQYYFLSAIGGCKNTTSSKVVTNEVLKIKEPSKCTKCEKLTFSNFVSSNEQYYFLSAMGDCKDSEHSKVIVDKVKDADKFSKKNIFDLRSDCTDRAMLRSEKKGKNKKPKKPKNGPEMRNNVGTITNKVSEIEFKISRLTVTDTVGLNSSKATDEKAILNEVKKRQKKKKKKKEMNAPQLSETDNGIAQKISYYSCDTLNKVENIPASAVSSSTGHKDKKRKSKFEKRKSKESKEEIDNFENYLPEEDILAGLSDGTLVSGQLRINARNYSTAYVSSKNKSESDFLIEGIRDRNRALEGDVVVLCVLPESMWKVTPTAIQKTAKIVFIKESVHARRAVGTIKLMADKNPEFALFSPNDSRLPRWQVPIYCCPADFYSNPSKYKNVFFEGVLTNWITPKLSRGFITEMLGEKGTIEAETMSLLREADCDTTPIPQSMFEACMQDIVFDEKILVNRQDLRHECIFSIDPEGAKDLDDAMSCKKLPNGNYEVGVHISDVAFYIRQGTPFDKAVCRKATTIYLVQRAYHMLPQELCYLCSLTPGEDKLAFSVFWELTPSAEIVSHRFTRSIIHSAVQLTYTHAQQVINNPGAASYDFPVIKNGYTGKDCAEQIIQLHLLASILRKKRFDNGALKIEIPKLWFKLDPTSSLPMTCSQYLLQEANWLIEEFMLLANFTVGKHIYETYPDIALLRHHKPPSQVALTELKKSLDKEEVFIDISSGAALYQSINQFDGADIESEAKRIVLSNLIAKPMPKALYYSSGLQKEASDFWHYALNAGYYTHFTSPIRRYADIIVHRLLAASLGYCEKPDYTKQEIEKAACISNKQKYCAKRAGELSSKLFLTLYVATHGPFIEKAAVLDIKDHSFDCVILRFGYIARVYTNILTGEAQVAHQFEDGTPSIFVYWTENVKKNIKASFELIKLFSLVTVELRKSEADMKLEIRLLPFY